MCSASVYQDFTPEMAPVHPWCARGCHRWGVPGKGEGMAPTVREIFRNNEEVRTVPAGTVIFTAGDTGDEMFGIISGMIELRVGDDVIATLGPDEVFGEMALVDKSP